MDPFFRLGVDEGNYTELPAIMAGGHRPGQLTRVFEKEVLRIGEVICQKWMITGKQDYGLPTNKDFDVYFDCNMRRAHNVDPSLAKSRLLAYSVHVKNDRHSSSVVRLGVDEGNHAEIPAIMAGGHRPGQLTRVFEKEVLRNGEVVRQKWKIMGTPDYGLPSNKDADVYYALMELSDEQRWPKKVHFSLYDLIERMGWGHGGNSYANARESLRRWATVRIEATNCFYVLKDREYRGTHVWGFIEEAYVPLKEEMSDRATPINYIVWNEHFYQSVMDGYVFSIDLDLYRRLRDRPLARRLYTFLNKKFGNKDAWGIDLKTMSHTHLGIAESRSSPAQIRAMLDPAIESLKQNGFLRSCSYRVGRRGVQIFFRKGNVSNARSIETPKAENRDPLKWLSGKLFGTTSSNFKQHVIDVADAFVHENGWQAWEEFGSFVAEYKRDHWPAMNSVGGALTLIARFLEGRQARAEERKAGAADLRRQQWCAYVDEQADAMSVSEPRAYAAFEERLKQDRLYKFWMEAAEGRHLVGGSENRSRRLESAREIFRKQFAKEFAHKGVIALDAWLAADRAIDAEPLLNL